MRTFSKFLFIIASAAIMMTACTPNADKSYSELTKSFIEMVEGTPELKQMLEESIEKAKAINPDKATNPGQSLEEYYDFIEWSGKCMPWDVIEQPAGRTLYNRMDQGICYAYFVFDQPLKSLENKGYYYPSLQYHEPIRSWLINYAKTWGQYLSTPESWNDEYLAAVEECGNFNMDKGWYEPSENWHSFNDFFHRFLSSPDVRPIDCPEDNSIVTLPADSKPQGIWKIDESSNIIQHEGVVIKSARVVSVEELVGNDSEFKKSFAGGTLVHTFLNVDDYHRYHFPLSGTVKDVKVIPGDDAAGGITIWDPVSQNYVLECEVPGWQMFETRGRIILDTEEFGIVAILPIGMSQVSSVNFESTVFPDAVVKKGDLMGWFDLGGSDIVMLFQKGVNVELLIPANEDGTYPHGYTGNSFVKLTSVK